MTIITLSGENSCSQRIFRFFSSISPETFLARTTSCSRKANQGTDFEGRFKKDESTQVSTSGLRTKPGTPLSSPFVLASVTSKETELMIFSEYKASVIHLLAVSVGRSMPGGRFSGDVGGRSQRSDTAAEPRRLSSKQKLNEHVLCKLHFFNLHCFPASCLLKPQL